MTVNNTQSSIQKLLGKNYKWWYLTLYTAKSAVAYRVSNYSYLISRAINLISIMSIWYININSGSDIFTMQEVFTYYILGEIFFYDPNAHHILNEQILSGEISSKLIRPSDYLTFISLDSLGFQLFTKSTRIFIGLVVASIGIYFDLFLLPSSSLNLIIFFLFAFISYFILNSFSILTGSISFWAKNSWGIIDLFKNLKNFTSGKLIPLNAFSWFQPLFFSPFAFTYYHVVQIYLGNYTTNQALLVLAGGIAWSIILYFLVKLVFKLGLKKNEAVGL